MRSLIYLGGAAIGAFFLWEIFKKPNMETWDKGTNAKILGLHPEIREDVAEIINDLYKQGIKVRVISGLRTFEQQQALYNKGRTAPGNIVTKAKPGQSYHNYGLAVDTVYPAAKKAAVVAAFKKKGFEWGGEFSDFPDPPHFQKRFGYTWQQFLTRNKYIKGTHYPIF